MMPCDFSGDKIFAHGHDSNGGECGSKRTTAVIGFITDLHSTSRDADSDTDPRGFAPQSSVVRAKHKQIFPHLGPLTLLELVPLFCELSFVPFHQASSN